jgi:glycine C-acetyltransferase
MNFCANNYLGLANNKELIAAAKNTLDSHGLGNRIFRSFIYSFFHFLIVFALTTGLASVRFICGTQNIHKELEKKIAEFHGTEDAILYPSCFDANAGNVKRLPLFCYLLSIVWTGICTAPCYVAVYFYPAIIFTN